MELKLLISAPTKSCSFGKAETSRSNRSVRPSRRTTANCESIGNRQRTTIVKSKTFHPFLK